MKATLETIKKLAGDLDKVANFKKSIIVNGQKIVISKWYAQVGTRYYINDENKKAFGYFTENGEFISSNPASDDILEGIENSANPSGFPVSAAEINQENPSLRGEIMAERFSKPAHQHKDGACSRCGAPVYPGNTLCYDCMED